MFTVYHSNQLDMLKNIAAAIIASKPLRDPLHQEVILVQSYGMARWIQIELAAQWGIAANIEFILLDSFILQMLTIVLPDIMSDKTTRIFSKQAMTWILMILLPRCRHRQQPYLPFMYLSEDDPQCYQLAALLADLFEQYLVFRPDWINSWQQGELILELGEAQLWQAQLWLALIAEMKLSASSTIIEHRANIYQCFIHAIEQHGWIRPSGLPERIFICGVSSLPPLYLQVLQALSRYVDIHVLFTNPCRYYWGDLNDRRRLVVGNPLLASWGKIGLDYLYLISQLEGIQEVEAFVEPTGDCLLSWLQLDILNLEDSSVLNEHKRLLRLDDRSISIHVCHSPQREVEVLYDNILAMFASDPTISPKDVIVMIADIDRYTPAIKTVFGNAAIERDLQFAISDRKTRSIYPVLLRFMSMLELPSSSFSVENVLALLELPALSAHFFINEEELKALRQWLVEFDITRRDELIGKTAMRTGSSILEYVENHLPDDLIGNRHFTALLRTLRHWRDYLAKPRKLNDWLTCVSNMIADFFTQKIDIATDNVLHLLDQKWQQFITCGIEVGYDTPIHSTILHDQLVVWLSAKEEPMNQHFLAGGINFCTLMPMRSLPFKVICLLGMNHGVYPRSFPKNSFDLMAKHTRRGDLNKRDYDRYLFLETILSAQQLLYISFIGRTIQDNTKRYPSVLVSELTEYIANSCYLQGDKPDAENSAERVRDHLWQWHSRTPFAPENFIPGSETQTFADEWLPAAKAQQQSRTQPSSFIELKLETRHINKLSLHQLQQFYIHPVRSWFQQRLAVFFSRLDQKDDLQDYDSPDHEPFFIDAITSYQLNYKLVNALIKQQNIDTLYRNVRAMGLLPYGAFGDLYWTNQYKEMNLLAKKVRKWYLSDRVAQTVNLNLCLPMMNNHFQLNGLIKKVQANGLLRWRPAMLSIKDGLLLWLEHLVYCAIGGKNDSRMFGLSGSQWHFIAIPAPEANSYLISILMGYCSGMNTPLLLLNRSGGAWLNYAFNPKLKDIDWDINQQTIARDKLKEAWLGNELKSGEYDDYYLRRLLPQQLDEEHIEAIIKAAIDYFLPVLINNTTQ